MEPSKNTFFAVLGHLSRALSLEDRQAIRMTCRWCSQLIAARPADFLTHGAIYRQWEFVTISARTDSTFGARVCDVAAFYGWLDLLKSARINGYAWTARSTAEAARGGHLELLKWMVAHKCPYDEWTPANAAGGGHTQVLKYASELYRDTPEVGPDGQLRAVKVWTSTTCSCAAANGRLDILEWAVAAGCKWSPETCAAAATGGHLHILVWLRTPKYPRTMCPWDGRTVSSALLGGHHRVAQWALANGCPWDPRTCPGSRT